MDDTPVRRRAAIAIDVAVALLVPAAALLLAELIHSTMSLNRLGLLFLAAVTVPASLRGSRAAVIAALAGALSYKLFLDLHSGETTTPIADMMVLAIFLAVALITGALAGKVRDEAAKSQRQADRMESLYRASSALADEDESTLWQTVADTLARASGGAAMALDSTGSVRARSGELDIEDSRGLQLGKEVLQASSNEIRRTAQWSARPVHAGNTKAGVLLWTAGGAESDELVELHSELASASLARAEARREQVRMTAAAEAGKLREALLSSVSHDFRSPLAAIIGSSTSLLEYGNKFDHKVRRDLLLNIQQEGEKLNQFVENLLNMTRLQSGAVQPVRKRIDASDTITDAIERLEAHTGVAVPVRTRGSCELDADPVLLEQSIYNILDNATKHGDPAQGIDVVCTSDETSCQISIADRGPGLPEEDLTGVFTQFHFVRKTGRTKGTGLGLSISRGFVEAMGGGICARNRSDGHGGLEVVIDLPRGN